MMPAEWTELDVHAVLKSMLLAIDRAKNPGSDERYVTLRGFSWIVEPTEGGVVIAMEIPMGAAVAGPFDIPQPQARRAHHPRAGGCPVQSRLFTDSPHGSSYLE